MIGTLTSLIKWLWRIFVIVCLAPILSFTLWQLFSSDGVDRVWVFWSAWLLFALAYWSYLFEKKHARSLYSSQNDEGNDQADRFPAIEPGGSKILNRPYQIAMRYSDSNGDLTDRIVDIHSFEPGNNATFFGYCHLRRDTRQFLFKRVVEAFDNETGEVISDLQNKLSLED